MKAAITVTETAITVAETAITVAGKRYAAYVSYYAFRFLL